MGVRQKIVHADIVVCQIDVVFFNEAEDSVNICRRNVNVFSVDSGSGVTRGNENSLSTRTLRNLPGHRVLTAAVTDYENFHRYFFQV